MRDGDELVKEASGRFGARDRGQIGWPPGLVGVSGLMDGAYQNRI